jgi:hypothetical protein
MSEYITNDNGDNRPMTEAETAEYIASLPELKAQNAAREKWEADQAAARQAVLDKLGLTQDEAQALLG